MTLSRYAEQMEQLELERKRRGLGPDYKTPTRVQFEAMLQETKGKTSVECVEAVSDSPTPRLPPPPRRSPASSRPRCRLTLTRSCHPSP